MPLFKASVLSNVDVAPDYLQMDFSWPEGVRPPVPGEFLTIRVTRGPSPLLRRPFGISAYTPSRGIASMIYWRRGPATRILAGYESGDMLDVMAPLGVGFTPPPKGTAAVLVAGGIGVGPILFFANELARAGREVAMLIGARSANRIPQIDIHGDVKVHRASDDGSIGFHGTAIELLETILVGSPGPRAVYLCGPNPMLKAGHECALRHGLTAWVSMEQTMGCGVGACMGCAVRVHGPEEYARVCTEGPVFRSTEIVWE